MIEPEHIGAFHEMGKIWQELLATNGTLGGVIYAQYKLMNYKINNLIKKTREMEKESERRARQFYEKKDAVIEELSKFGERLSKIEANIENLTRHIYRNGK